MSAAQRLLPSEVAATIPRLYAQEHVEDHMVYAKFFTPDSGWTWYVLEYDGDDLCFGWVIGFEQELGYFALSEIGTVPGPHGLLVERDVWFRPMPLSVVQKTRP